MAANQPPPQPQYPPYSQVQQAGADLTSKAYDAVKSAAEQREAAERERQAREAALTAESRRQAEQTNQRR